MRILKSSEGFALVVALLMAFVILIVAITIFATVTNEYSLSGRSRSSYLAMSIAEAGVDKAIADLISGIKSPSQMPYQDSGTLNGGTFQTSIVRENPADPMSNRAIITSIGTHGKMEKTAKVKIEWTWVTTPQIPDIYQYAIYSDGNMQLAGNLTTSSYCSLPPSDPNYIDNRTNGDVGTAGDMKINGTVNIQGSATAAGSITLVGGGGVSGTNLNGDPNTITPNNPNANQPMPAIDLAHYKSIAQSQGNYYTSNISWNGGTIPSGVYYTKGKVTISGQVTATDVLIVAEGDISLTGGATMNIPSTLDINDPTTYPSGAKFALITTSNVKLAGGAKVAGVIYADNVNTPTEASFTGGAQVFGAILADSIKGSGTFDVHYDEALRSTNLDLPGTQIINGISNIHTLNWFGK